MFIPLYGDPDSWTTHDKPGYWRIESENAAILGYLIVVLYLIFTFGPWSNG